MYFVIQMMKWFEVQLFIFRKVIKTGVSEEKRQQLARGKRDTIRT